MNIGNAVRALRLAKNHSMADMSASCGVSLVHLGNIERGLHTNMSLMTVEKICGYFKLTTEELQRLEDFLASNSVYRMLLDIAKGQLIIPDAD